MPNLLINDRNIKNLLSQSTSPKGERHYDLKLAGFGVWVSSKKTLSFFLRYRIHGIEKFFKIGRYPEWSAMTARQEAEKLKVDIDKGIDPLNRRQNERNAPTYSELWSEYCVQIKSRKAEMAQRDEDSMARDYILPAIGRKRVKDIDHIDLSKLHRHITDLGRPYRANRVLEVVRGSLNLAIQLKWIDSNPAIGFKKNPENPRERYLSEEEMQSLHMALLNDEDQRQSNVVKLLLLTGARLGEVLKAEWEQFNLDKGTWTKPSSHTKQRRLHHVPLSSAAIDLLQEIQRTTNSRFVFPQINNPEAHIVDIKRLWTRLMKRTGIKNFRIHDLRHTYASCLVSNGLSLPIVGKLLGHTQAATTMRYAHLNNNPLREATNLAASVLGFNKQPTKGANHEQSNPL